MKKNANPLQSQLPADPGRRQLIGGAGAGVMVATLGGVMASATREAKGATASPLRWGIVSTGWIASSMVPMIEQAGNAELTAVSSRKMASAKAFADKHGVPNAFDSWADMISSDTVDAVYVATPTSVREEICIAAAAAGKHVLGEKPFANLESMRRITRTCRDNGVGFMDGTHFVHQPRTAHIKARMAEDVGWPWSVASAFQFGLTDPGNIRMNPDLEPYGAIGDAGWYNMRAAVEYLPATVKIESVDAYMRRSSETGAAVTGSGIIVFDDGSSTTWNCGFESGGAVMDLRISGAKGVVKMDDFLSQRPPDQPASYELSKGWAGSETVQAPSNLPGAAQMFQDFADMVHDPSAFEASVTASERTQEWLDAIWNSALANEA